MGAVEIDTQQIRVFAADIRAADARTDRALIPVMRKAARGAAAVLRKDLKKSRNKGFRFVAGAVDWEVFTGSDGAWAEIGPNPARHGNLENIAYFGSWKGGGTVRDPGEAGEEYAPGFAALLEDYAEQILSGERIGVI